MKRNEQKLPMKTFSFMQTIFIVSLLLFPFISAYGVDKEAGKTYNLYEITNNCFWKKQVD